MLLIRFIWCASTLTTSHLILNVRKLSVDCGVEDLDVCEDAQHFELPQLPNSSGYPSFETVVNVDPDLHPQISITSSVEKTVG